MKSPTLDSHDVLLLIEEARDAEMCRDMDMLQELLSKVWKISDIDPDYSNFGLDRSAELLRLTGVFISEYGRGRGLIDQQIRAKNILTRAIDLFSVANNREKFAETTISLAACYWFSGEVEEYNAILRSLETEFAQNQCIYLKIQINRIAYLGWKGDDISALRIIESFYRQRKICVDQKLQAQFNNQAGITYQMAGRYKEAIEYLLEASDISRSIKNYRFLGQNLNCLSMTYRLAGDFVSAHDYATEAISVFESINANGWIPHVLDTRALIFLDQGHIEEALETINKSIAAFSEGEDYSGLTEAMFTKCRCLLRLKRVEEAYALFSELGHIAEVRIGEAALKKYSAMLAEEVRFIGGKTFREKTDHLKRQLIREALRASGGNMVKAADTLGESHQALSFMLKNKFPEIYLELGIKRRPRVSSPSIPKKPLVPDEPAVQHVMMPKSMKYAYNFHVEETPVISTFLIAADLMVKLGIMGRKLVAVAKIGELRTDVPILYEERDGSCHGIGRLIYDKLTKLYVIHVEEEDEFVFPADVSVIGVPIGYCDLDSVNRDMLRFKKIRFE